MKAAALLAALLVLLLFHAPAASAATIELSEFETIAVPGTPIAIAIRIAGLGASTAPSLGAFDLDVSFDPLHVSFNIALYGDPVLGDLLDVSGGGSIQLTTPGAASVNLAEISLDPASLLDAFQPDAFTLATLIFDPVMTSSTPTQFGLSPILFGDAQGDPLAVTVIPEPSSLLLLAVSLTALAAGRSRARTGRER